MEKYLLKILGSGAALPSNLSNQSAQVLSMCGRNYMIDCGENAQAMLRKYNVNHSKLNHIFISHLHGDHCFGLLGLISTLDMLGRMCDITIFSHPGLKDMMKPMMAHFFKGLHFNVHFEEFAPGNHELIYDCNGLEVYSVPLKHTIPSSGFVFREKEKQRHIIRSKVDFYKVPVRMMQHVKNGEDFVTEEGKVIPNSELTSPADPIRSFAYISDSAKSERIVEYISGVDLLFHESTFLEENKLRAKQTLHSTARQAAEIAKMADVKKLVLGHFSARYKSREMFLSEAREVFENCSLGNDGAEFEF